MIAEKFKQAIERGAENVKEHTPMLKAGVLGDYPQLWRCTQGNSSIYGFDLVISRFGIAMFGDTGSLVFNVGSSYGIDFLARKSVCSYMISKVEEKFRQKTELNIQALGNLLYDCGAQKFFDTAESDLPEWLDVNDCAEDRHDQHMPKLLAAMQEEIDNGDTWTEEYANFIREYREVLGDQKRGNIADNGLDAVHNYLSEQSDELCLYPEWYEANLGMYSSGLITKLEMLRLMAHKIKEITDASK